MVHAHDDSNANTGLIRRNYDWPTAERWSGVNAVATRNARFQFKSVQIEGLWIIEVGVGRIVREGNAKWSD